VNGERQQFLAGATFTVDQHAGIAGGCHFGLEQHGFDHRAVADEILAPGIFFLPASTCLGLRDAQCVCNLAQQFLAVERFGEKAEDAALGSFDGLRN